MMELWPGYHQDKFLPLPLFDEPTAVKHSLKSTTTSHWAMEFGLHYFVTQAHLMQWFDCLDILCLTLLSNQVSWPSCQESKVPHITTLFIQKVVMELYQCLDYHLWLASTHGVWDQVFVTSMHLWVYCNYWGLIWGSSSDAKISLKLMPVNNFLKNHTNWWLMTHIGS